MKGRKTTPDGVVVDYRKGDLVWVWFGSNGGTEKPGTVIRTLSEGEDGACLVSVEGYENGGEWAFTLLRPRETEEQAKALRCSWCGHGPRDDRGVVVGYLRGPHHAGCLTARLDSERGTGRRTKGRGE